MKKNIKKYIKKRLTKERYRHSLGVAYTAIALAMKYNPDTSNSDFMKKAELAGLLHDCAKNMDNDKKIHICDKNNISYSSLEAENAFLLHGKVGAYIAKTKFGIEDEDILNAIIWHTTGRPGMSILEKIIFIADYIEPNRKTAPNLDEVRKLAFDNIDECLYKILDDSLNYLSKKNMPIDPMTEQTFQFYKKELNK